MQEASVEKEKLPDADGVVQSPDEGKTGGSNKRFSPRKFEHELKSNDFPLRTTGSAVDEKIPSRKQ